MRKLSGAVPADLRLWPDKTAQRHFEQTLEKSGSVPNLDL
jgi:hypothetical protein